MIKTFERAVEEGHKELLVYESFNEPVFMADHVGCAICFFHDAENKLLYGTAIKTTRLHEVSFVRRV